MKIEDGIKLNFKDVAIRPNRTTLSSRSDVVLTRKFNFYHSPKTWLGFPLISANMSSISGWQMADVFSKYQAVCCLHKYLDTDDIINYLNTKLSTPYVWPTIGMSDNDLKNLEKLSQIQDLNICVDIANGHIDKFVSYCAKVRNIVPNAIILAGNVCISEMTQELIIHGGVDIVKVGIGPGSLCSTKNVTGVTWPQLSAADSCAIVAHGLKSEEKRLGLVCSDGGCKEIGDICKAFCVSDFVMIGTLLAGTSECSGWHPFMNLKLSYDNKPDYDKQMYHYGMSSHYAQELHTNTKKDYRASEGKITTVGYKGKTSDLLNEILGGIRSCCTYIGANSIKDMSKCATFIRVNS